MRPKLKQWKTGAGGQKCETDHNEDAEIKPAEIMVRTISIVPVPSACPPRIDDQPPSTYNIHATDDLSRMRLRMHWFAVLAIMLSTLITACVSTPSPDAMKQVAERNRWELAHWGDHAVPYGDDGEPVILAFRDGKVSGQAGCNRYAAVITFGPKTGEVSVSHGISTRMACVPRRMEFEAAFIRAFEASTRYRLDGESLSFESAIAQPLEFYRRPLE